VINPDNSKPATQAHVIQIGNINNLKYYLEKGLFSRKSREECPTCHHNTFCIKKDKTLAKCFHPSCNLYISIYGGQKTSIYTEAYELFKEFYKICHDELLRQADTANTEFPDFDSQFEAKNAYNYCVLERKIHPKVLKQSMIGVLPPYTSWQPIMQKKIDELTQKHTAGYKQSLEAFNLTHEEFERILGLAKNGVKMTDKESKAHKAITQKNKDISILHDIFDKFYNVFKEFAAGWLAFFYTDHRHNIKSIKIRKPYASSKSCYLFKPFTAQGFFNHGLFSPGDNNIKDEERKKWKEELASRILLMEGEFNQLQLQSLLLRLNLDFIHAAAWGSAASLHAQDVLSANWKPVVIYDNDEAGHSVLEKLQADMTFAAFTTPTPDSDLDDFVMSFKEDYKEAYKSLKALMNDRKIFYWQPDNIDWAKVLKPGGKGVKICYPRIAEHFIERYKPFTIGGKVFMYENGLYSPDKIGNMRHQIQRLMREETTSFSVNEIMGYIERHEPISTAKTDRQACNLINLKNGMLDWRAGKLLPHDPKYFSTIRIPLNYDPDAKSELIEKYLKTTLDPSIIPLVEEFAGYLLIPETKFEKGIIATGGGDNGKSTFIALLEGLIGRENMSGLSLQDITSDDKFVVSVLFRKLANLYDDLDNSLIQLSGKIKLLISGKTTITAQEKFRDPFEFQPFARFIFTCNELPATRDRTHGFWRKWLIIPFEKQFRAGDKNTIRGLDEMVRDTKELSGFLNMAVGGLRRLHHNNVFSKSEKIEEAMSKYQKQADPVRAFVDDVCILGKTYEINRKLLYKDYCEYCEDSGIKSLGRNKFYSHIETTFNLKTRKKPDFRVFCGIGIKSEEEGSAWDVRNY